MTQATGETSELSVMRGGKMIFIDQVSGTHWLRTFSSVGEVFPMTTTAKGRACLAKLPRDIALKYAATEASPAGIELDLSAFAGLLDQIGETGLAYDNDEHSDGISAVGFAFQDLAGELHAISVPVPSSSFARQLYEIDAAVRRVAGLIKKAMQT